MLVVVRLSPAAKNVPGRNRSGFKFGHEPSVADVTVEQFESIKSDPFLKICNFPSVAWFQAMNIERTQKNEDSYKDKDGNFVSPKKAPKDAIMAVELDAKAPTPVAKANVAPAPSGKDVGGMKEVDQKTETKPEPTKTVELTASSPVEELVKALVRKGKVAGKDFQPNAKAESLFAMLKTL